MNPLSIIPKKARLALYLIFAVGIVVLKYTETKGWTGPDEQDLWLNLGIAVGALAASNVPPQEDVVTIETRATVEPSPAEDVYVVDEYVGEHRRAEEG